MTNTQFKRLIQEIEVDKDGNVDIYLRLIGDLGLDETVLMMERKVWTKTQATIKKNKQNQKKTLMQKQAVVQLQKQFQIVPTIHAVGGVRK